MASIACLNRLNRRGGRPGILNRDFIFPGTEIQLDSNRRDLRQSSYHDPAVSDRFDNTLQPSSPNSRLPLPLGLHLPSRGQPPISFETYVGIDPGPLTNSDSALYFPEKVQDGNFVRDCNFNPDTVPTQGRPAIKRYEGAHPLSTNFSVSKHHHQNDRADVTERLHVIDQRLLPNSIDQIIPQRVSSFEDQTQELYSMHYDISPISQARAYSSMSQSPQMHDGHFAVTPGFIQGPDSFQAHLSDIHRRHYCRDEVPPFVASVARIPPLDTQNFIDQTIYNCFFHVSSQSRDQPTPTDVPDYLPLRGRMPSGFDTIRFNNCWIYDPRKISNANAQYGLCSSISLQGCVDGSPGLSVYRTSPMPIKLSNLASNAACHACPESLANAHFVSANSSSKIDQQKEELVIPYLC